MRYQIDPRSHHFIDRGRATRAVEAVQGVSRPSWAFPTMGTKGHSWRGTNQPKTMRFTAADDETAAAVGKAYGTEDAFIWNISTMRYV